jgi:hypothetical protein
MDPGLPLVDPGEAPFEDVDARAAAVAELSPHARDRLGLVREDIQHRR